MEFPGRNLTRKRYWQIKSKSSIAFSGAQSNTTFLRVTRQEGGHVFRRVAYNSADDEQWLALDGVRLIPIRKKNMQPHAWADEYDLGLYRKRIESVNSQLESMGVEHLKARTHAGLEIKLHASLLAVFCTDADLN